MLLADRGYDAEDQRELDITLSGASVIRASRRAEPLSSGSFIARSFSHLIGTSKVARRREDGIGRALRIGPSQ